MSTEANNNAQTTRVAPAGTASVLGATTAAVSHPAPPPAPAILASRGIEPHHHAYAPYPPPPYYHHPPSHHYHPTQSEVPVHHPGQPPTNAQVAEANILSSMKKAPLATIVDNPAQDEEGGEEEFGKLSGRKLDSSFAEGSVVQNSNGDGIITSQHRAPTPLLLSPENATDGATTRSKARSDDVAGASKGGSSSNSVEVDDIGDSAEARPASTGGAGRTKTVGASSVSEEAGHTGDAPPSSKLSELDAMTCHNIEVFQATKEDAEAFESAEAVLLLGTSTATKVICGHVGFRCVHCLAGEQVGPVATGNSGLSVVYPASVGTISTALRHMRDHFDSCEAMSEESKNAFADARREEEEQDAGLGCSSRKEKSGGKNGPDERRRTAFLDFCVDFCQRKDIINVQPQRSGLKYRLPIDASSSLTAVEVAATGTSSAGMPRQGAVPVTEAMSAKKDDESLLPTSLPAVTNATTAVPPNVGNYVPNFPFFSDGHGAWICRYCCSVPYPYRGAGSVWNAPNQAPPTREFVDQHMKLCKGGAPPPPQRVVVTARAPLTPHTPQMPPLPGNAIEAKSGTVSMRTIQMIPPHQQLSGPRASPAGGAISTPQHFYRMSPQILRSPHMPSRGIPPHPYHPNPNARPLPAQPPSRRPPIAPITAPLGKKAQRRGTRAPRAPPPTQKELKLPPGVDGSGSDVSLQAAITFLAQQESSRCLPPPKDPQIQLVGSEDKLLLTDYFSHLMRQLRLVRFSEADRKTRGGKREKVVLGYGGLECVHCIGQPGARKFFWSNVDRLSNSFAEIPAHILKCKYCAPEVKAALLELKTCHAKQMASLPRGSQKVYLRRVWRRIHDGDPSPSSSGSASLMPMLPPSLTNGGVAIAQTAAGTGAAARGSSTVAAAGSGTVSRSRSAVISSVVGAGASLSMPPLPNQGDSGDDSPSSIERSATKSLASLAATGTRRGSAPGTPPSRDTAVTSTAIGQGGTDQVMSSNPTVIIGPHTRLIGNPNAYVDATPSCGTCKHGAEALFHAAAAQSTGEYQSHPIVMLAIREDQEWLSDHDCFVRRNLEVFTAGEKDVLTARADRKLGVTVGQVGIRCLHCAVAVSRYSNGRRGARGTAVVYPNSISSIFECVKELHRNHLEDGCPHLPPDAKLKILELKGSMASSLSSVLRRYYVMAAKALGMVDCGKEGIRAGGMSRSVPLTEHEYAAASDRVSRDVPSLAGPLHAADVDHLRTRAIKVVAAVTAASGQDATSSPTGSACDTKAMRAAVVEKAETTPTKYALPDPDQPGKPRTGGPTRPTIGSSNCDASVKLSKEASDASHSVPQKTRGLAIGGAGAAPATATPTATAAAPPVTYGYAPSMASVPPTHYGGYRYGGAYGGPSGPFNLASAITPLESRKRKAPLARETPPDRDEAQRPTSSRKKTRRF